MKMECNIKRVFVEDIQGESEKSLVPPKVVFFTFLFLVYFLFLIWIFYYL